MVTWRSSSGGPGEVPVDKSVSLQLPAYNTSIYYMHGLTDKYTSQGSDQAITSILRQLSRPPKVRASLLPPPSPQKFNGRPLISSYQRIVKSIIIRVLTLSRKGEFISLWSVAQFTLVTLLTCGGYSQFSIPCVCFLFVSFSLGSLEPHLFFTTILIKKSVRGILM